MAVIRDLSRHPAVSVQRIPRLGVRGRAIGLIAACQTACLTLWFSASAMVPELLAAGTIDGQRAAWLTGAVQLGFVAGTLASALSGLADRFDPRRLFAAAALAGAIANVAILFVALDGPGPLALRFLVGASLAGVYPVGMKMAAGWAERDMGLMIGGLVGALTLGSALPHLFAAVGGVDWRTPVAAASICASAAAVAVGFVTLGPGHRTSPGFRPREAVALLRQRPLLLVQAAYLGHMWELYAMWAWIGAFLAWALGSGDAAPAPALVALATFAVVAAGAGGCLLGGALADRWGRTTVTIAAMATSGLCAAVIGLSAEAGVVVVLAVAVVWGVAVIADGPQFFAAAAELTEPRLVGTMLTLQTCLGFLLTVAAIRLMPVAVEVLTWRWAFAVLAAGPFLGALAMWRLRRLPEAVRLAGGRR